MGEQAGLMAPGLYHMDCMEAMRSFPDGFFDLAVVDPPYGGANSDIGGAAVRPAIRPIQAGRTGGTWASKYGKKIIAWDTAPKQEYFDELLRVSRDQIIWGGNYFGLPPTRCFLVWDKRIPEDFSMAMCEYAWTSMTGNAKIYVHTPQGTKDDRRFHPTQKPVALYSWILSKYAKPGFKILDTHAGSASSLVAAHRAGLDAWGFEIDEHYFKLASERLAREKAQVTMFEML